MICACEYDHAKGVTSPCAAHYQLIRRATETEREACAKVAEERSAQLANDSDMTRGYACGRAGAAADIRARGQQ